VPDCQTATYVIDTSSAGMVSKKSNLLVQKGVTLYLFVLVSESARKRLMTENPVLVKTENTWDYTKSSEVIICCLDTAF
jgi:hypothetical protein